MLWLKASLSQTIPPRRPTAADMEDSSLRELAVELSRASAVLTKAQVGHVMKLCEVVKHQLQSKVDTLLSKASGRPVLMSYSSDGTPMKTAARVSSEGLVPGTALIRRGRDCVELLLQRGWYKTFGANGQTLVAALLRDPVPLTHGKSAWHLYSAARSFAPFLEEAGHQGISISHYAFDRACYSALTRRLSQSHAVAQARVATESFEASPGVPKAWLSWFAATPCAMHDAQNGLKWAMSPYMVSSAIVQDLHIAIESLRNSVLLLHSHLGLFVRGAIAFTHEPYDRDEVYEFWVALGVGADVIDEIVDLNPWYTDGQLWVSGKWEHSDILHERISVVFLHVFRLKRFAETRWCTAGASCRALTACLAVGLEKLVTIVREDPKASDYYIHGFTRLRPPVKKYMALAAVVSYVPDSFLGELLEDDRITKRLGVFESVMTEELAWLEGLKPLTWQRLAHLAGNETTPQALRSEALLGGQAACSFVTNRVLTAAKGMPWCLARGDLDAKLKDLASLSEPPADDTAAKVYRLVRQGRSKRLPAEPSQPEPS